MGAPVPSDFLDQILSESLFEAKSKKPPLKISCPVPNGTLLTPSIPATPITPITPGTPATPNTSGKKSTMADFKLMTVLGEGNYGRVIKAKRIKGEEVVALKIMQKDELIRNDVLEWVEQEKVVVDLIQKKPHPFVSKVEETFRTKAAIVHVMEFLPGGDLLFHLNQSKKFSCDQAKFYFAEVALALHHLHQNNIIYRDLKPDNVLLQKDGHVALADFGFAKVLDPKCPQETAFCGSLEFLAPEMINGDIKPYSFEVDWWSAGVLLYNMLTGHVPWTHDNPVICYDNICSAPLPKRKLDGNAFNFLLKMLSKNLKDRLSNFDAIKSHPFMSDIDWDKLEKREIPPPFVPDISDDDTKYFAKEMTSSPTELSNNRGQNGKGQKGGKKPAAHGKGKGNTEGKKKKRK